MYAVHGNTEMHTACLELLITSGCNLNLQANGNHSSSSKCLAFKFSLALVYGPQGHVLEYLI